MAVDVVEAVLRIVLRRRRSRVLPELAVTHRFDNPAQAQVVVGDGRFGGRHAGPRAGGVVVGSSMIKSWQLAVLSNLSVP